MPSLNLTEAAKIGFNESVDVGGRPLHVQTEVLTLRGGLVRTTILDGGIAKFVKTEPLPANLASIDALVTLVKGQHDRYVGHLKQTGKLWQDSI